MNTYRLTRHANNTFSVDTGRDYFNPISNYYFLAAHDIIEHTEVPHPNNTIDELMAIGAMLRGRSYYIDTSIARSEHIERIGFYMYKILNDLGPLSEVCHSDYTGEALFGEVYNSVETGISKYIEMKPTSERQISFNAADITNWMFHGQKLFLERFANPQGVSTTLFDGIKAKIKIWHSRGEKDGLLCVDFDTLQVDLSFTGGVISSAPGT